MMNPPLVSIGMPVFNGERFMKEAIDSLLEQTFREFELLIVDNASTDGTQQIALHYAEVDRRVKYYRFRENYGVAHNWRMTFKLSSGRYFKWAAYDDICAPEYIDRCIEALEHDASAVLAFPLTVGIGPDGNRTGIPTRVGPRHQRTAEYSDRDQASVEVMASPDPVVRFRALLDALWNAHFIYGVIRSDALSRISVHPSHYAGDHLMLAELSLHGRFRLIPQELFFLRIHEQKTSKTQSLAALSADDLPIVGGEAAWKLLHGYPQRLGAYRRAIGRSPLSPAQKARCYGEVVRAVGSWSRAKARQSLGSNR